MTERAGSLREALGGKLISLTEPTPKRIYLEVESRELLEVVRVLFEKFSARFITASALEGEKEFEILYHFGLDAESRVVSIRIKVPLKNPVVMSLTSLSKASEFIEREIFEMFGIKFLGHPNLKPLLLGEDWKEGEPPLRREK